MRNHYCDWAVAIVLPLVFAATTGWAQADRLSPSAPPWRPIPAQADNATLACLLPPLAPRSSLAVIAVEQGNAIPTVSLGGDATLTTYGEIEIDRFARPTYIVVHPGSPMILRFTGATWKITQVVALGSPSGIVGIAADRIARPDCEVPGRFFRSGEAKGFFRRVTGREPDQFAHIHRFGRLSLPSGPHGQNHAFENAIQPDLSGPAGAIWKRFAAFRPNGYVYITPGSVMSDQPVTRYRIPPQEAGLARLVETGALSIIDPGTHDETLEAAPGGGVKWQGITIHGGGAGDTLVADGKVFGTDVDGGWHGGRLPTLRIEAETALPAGLRGIHGAIFVLPEGVPRPRGDLNGVRIEAE